MVKTTLITGTSSGIGKETAKLFLEKGWNVIATRRDTEKENDLDNFDNVLITKLDVCDIDSIKNSIKLGIEKFGEIDVIVNNAGYGAMGILEEFDREGIKRQMDVNVLGLIDTTKEIIPHFRKNKKGVIINVSSILGKVTFPLSSLYCASKFAVEGFSEGLSYEMSKIGVKVKIIEPGAIKTDFATRSFDYRVNDNLVEYGNISNSLMSALGPAIENAPNPKIVAEKIFEAATDDTNTLRYLVGEDAKFFEKNRKDLGEEEFVNSIKKQFNI